MPVLQLAGNRIALGLQWSFLADRAELRRVLKRDAVPGYAVAGCDDGLLYGAFDEVPAGRTLPCAGGLLVGQLLRDAIVYQDLGNGQVWVCAVRDGLPLPGVDRVCGAGEAERLMQDVQLHSQRLDMPLIGSLPQASLALAELLEQTEPAMLSQARLRRPVTQAQYALRAAMALGVLACLGIVWQILHREAPQVVAPMLEEIGLPVNRAEIEARYRDAVQQQLNAERSRLLERPDFAAAGEAWLREVRGLPFAVGGYKPRLLSCTGQNCRVDWDWQASQFNPQDLERLPGLLLPAAAAMERATRAQTELSLQVAAKRLTPWSVQEVDKQVLSLGSRLQKLGARAEITPAELPASINVAASADDQQARERGANFASKSLLVGHQGQVRLVVGDWARVQAVLGVLAEQPLVPERAIFTLNNGNVSLQLEARYVVLVD